MAQTKAWLLDLGEGLTAALGSVELLEVVTDPQLFAVPQTPPHCNRTLIWRERIVPVMDLARWLKSREVSRGRLYAAIVAYADPHHADDSPELAALLVSGIPQQRMIDDEDACPLPREPKSWREVSWSCFSQGGLTYPVLALERVFSRALA